MLMPKCFLIILFITFIPQFSLSTEVDDKKIPPILHPDHRHQKANQVEISPYGGSFLGDTLGQTWLAGNRVYYHIDSTFAVGANYSFTKLMTDKSFGFGAAMTNSWMQGVGIEGMISNDAAFRVGNNLVEMDFYLTLGAAGLKINKSWEPAGIVGGGVKFYTGIPWLAFRIDVNNYIHFTTWPGDQNLDCDVTFLGGVSFLFPERKRNGSNSN